MSLADEPKDVYDVRAGAGGRARRIAAALVLAVVACVLAAVVVPEQPRAQAVTDARPNVLVVMTDDQTVAQMRALPAVRRRIARRGTRFANSFVNYPLCCPSRATFLTGLYARNHGVRDNQPPKGGYERFDPNETLGVWLQRAGYYTGHVGKYLNGYGRADETVVPPGWSEWFVPLHNGIDDVYDYALNDHGSVIRYGSAPEDFKQDVISERALDFIGRRAHESQPFFLFVGYTAPHFAGPEPNPQPPADCEGDEVPKPAPRHADEFVDEPLPLPPSFNEANVFDKPPSIASLPPLAAEEIDEIGRAWRCGLAELLSVDEGVQRMIGALRAAGELESTVIVFTSDNGFFFGEHRIASGKKRPYEEAIRVPLAIRGPGFRRGAVIRELVSNADLAPTILEATGAAAGLTLDGRSLYPFVRHPGRLHGRELLIESNRFDAVRTWRYSYVENDDGSVELYDVIRDPFQLDNIATRPTVVQEHRQLARRLAGLRRCEGERCRREPALRLKLLPADEGAAGCSEPPVRALIQHGSEPVQTVGFRINGRADGRRNRAPFRRRLPRPLLESEPKAVVEATVDLLDGRRATLIRRTKLCR